MYCRNCGTEIPEGSKFCGNCGINLSVSNEPIEEEITIVHKPGLKDDKPNKTHRKKGKRHGFLRFLLVLAAIIFLAFLYITKDVFVCSQISYQPASDFTEADKNDIEQHFLDTYLWRYPWDNDGYYVGNKNTGLGFYSKDLEKNSLSDDVKAKFEISGYFARIVLEIDGDDANVTISYNKASIIERFNFFIRFFI